MPARISALRAASIEIHVFVKFDDEYLRGRQRLREKQRLREQYGIREKQLPEDHDILFTSLARSAETMERWQVDYRIRGTDGQIKWLHVDAMPELDAAQGIVWYGFVTDVTVTIDQPK